MTDEPMQVQEVIKRLNIALPLQMRSAVMFTWAAGSVTGLDWQAVGTKLEAFAETELGDARRLVEKITALGGEPVGDVASFEPRTLPQKGIEVLISCENEALDALREVIPPTGQEARSEALEHLMEHIILRKQSQVDFLLRVRG